MQQRLGQYNGIYNNQIEITKDVKRASINNARKIFYEKMDNDPKFKEKVLNTLWDTDYYDPKSMMDYKKYGKKSNKLYDKFNQALATPAFQKAGIHNEFYSELKKKGYNAILDINDTKYSGYKDISKDPTIFFGDDKWKKIGSKKLTDEEIDLNANKYAMQYVAKNMAKQYGIYGGAYGVYKTVSDQRKIDKYLDEHPDSKLSDKEILKIVNKKKQ